MYNIIFYKPRAKSYKIMHVYVAIILSLIWGLNTLVTEFTNEIALQECGKSEDSRLLATLVGPRG